MAIMLPMALLLVVIFSSAGAMTELKEIEMAEITGQALLQMGKTPGAGGFSDITFYKAGLDAELELNMNIDKLQLGCTAGAINGQHCDIDIDQMSLSGQTWGSDGRPTSGAILTRPFFEFAIKNDSSKTLREVVGIRMSAEQAKGMLTAGDQTPSMTDAQSNNGINSLSGYMVLGSTSGVAQTAARSATQSELGRKVTGRIFVTVCVILCFDGNSPFSTNSYTLNVASTNANVFVPSTVISGKRLSSVDLIGSATIDSLPLSGQINATINNVVGSGISLTLDKTISGSINGLTATVPIQQSLGLIHKILIDSPFSLSMQQQDLLWPGAAAQAQSGWWMAFEDEIDIGGISPEAQVAITDDVLLQAIGPENPAWTPNPDIRGDGIPVSCVSGPSVNCALTIAATGDSHTYTSNNVTYNEVHGLDCNGISACLGGSLPIGNLSVPLNLDFPLSDLKLSGQSVTPNCYGSARFC